IEMAANREVKRAKTVPVKAVAPVPPKAPPSDADLDWIRGLAEIATANGLAELKVRTARATVVVRRGAGPVQHAGLPGMHVHPGPHPMAQTIAAVPVPPPPVGVAAVSVAPAAATTPVPAAAPESPEDGASVQVSSPFVGTFYRSPSPEAPYFVEVGQRVKK